MEKLGTIEQAPEQPNLFRARPIDDHVCESFTKWAKYSHTKETPKSPEAEDEMLRIYANLGANSHLAISNLISADDRKIGQISARLDQFSDFFQQIAPEDDSQVAYQIVSGFRNLAVSYVSRYDEHTFTDEATDAILEKARQIAENPDMEKGINNEFREIEEAIQVTANEGAPEVFEQYYNAYHELENSPNNRIDSSKWNTKSGLLRSYAFNHDINAQRLQAFHDRVIPAIESGDPAYDSLVHSSNSFGTAPGEFGITDYTIHVLTSETNPRNVRDLMQTYRTIPTEDYAKFESNRRDAIALQGVLWDGRDFIHDERPGVHELIGAMVDFYDSKDNPETHAKKTAKLQKVVNTRLDPKNRYFYGGFDGEKCFDLANYDTILEGTVRADTRSDEDYDQVPAIDVLRRLEENTRQISLEKPHSGDAELDALIEKAMVSQSQDGENFVDFQSAGELVTRANQILAEKQGGVNLTPSFIKTLSYIERVETYAMRGISHKDYQELGFDPGFKEICRFHELTSTNRPYSEGNFEQFWRGFMTEFGRDWPNNVTSAYGRLSQHILSDLESLAKSYNEQGAPRYMTDSLWSGNLNHELVGLTDER